MRERRSFKGCRPEEGALAFRVWQIRHAMVAYLKDDDVLRFVAIAGVMVHYVGDASQPALRHSADAESGRAKLSGTERQ